MLVEDPVFSGDAGFSLSSLLLAPATLYTGHWILGIGNLILDTGHSFF